MIQVDCDIKNSGCKLILTTPDFLSLFQPTLTIKQHQLANTPYKYKIRDFYITA